MLRNKRLKTGFIAFIVLMRYKKQVLMLSNVSDKTCYKLLKKQAKDGSF